MTIAMERILARKLLLRVMMAVLCYAYRDASHSFFWQVLERVELKQRFSRLTLRA